MSRETGWHDVHDAMDCPCGRAGGHDALLQALAERLCPIPRRDRPGDPHRSFGQDLPLLSDTALALEAERVTLRACMESEGPDLRWLLRRLERVRHEQACREDPRPPDAGSAPVGPRPDEEELERARERRNHEAWLRWNAEQTGAAR
jgi:hypothetical protein